MKKLFLACASVAAISQPAMADIEPYVGIGVGQSKAYDNLKVNVAAVRGGVTFNNIVGVEGELIVGSSSDTNVYADTSSFRGVEEFDLKASGAVFVVGHIPIAENFSLFGRVGGFIQNQETNIESTRFFSGNSFDSSTSFSDTVHGLAYGVGADFYLPDSPVGFRIDYTRYGIEAVQRDDELYEADGDLDTITGSVMFRF